LLVSLHIYSLLFLLSRHNLWFGRQNAFGGVLKADSFTGFCLETKRRAFLWEAAI